MDEILIAIRNELVADSTLTDIVASGDIRTAFVEKEINYPEIVIDYSDFPSQAEFADVFRGGASVTVWSETNNLECITVLNRVKALLHNKERNVTDSGIVFHSIRYVGPGTGPYMSGTDTWRRAANYAIEAEDV